MLFRQNTSNAANNQTIHINTAGNKSVFPNGALCLTEIILYSLFFCSVCPTEALNFKRQTKYSAFAFAYTIYSANAVTKKLIL